MQYRVWLGVLICIGATVFGLSVSSEAGGDRQHHSVIAYPGASCQVPFEDGDLPFLRGNADIFTTADSQLAVPCPIVRTRHNSDAGARVEVVVAPSGVTDLPGHMHCGLSVLNRDGSQFLESTAGTAVLEPGDTGQTIRLRVRQSPPGAYYYLQCLFPVNSVKIVQYIVTEF